MNAQTIVNELINDRGMSQSEIVSELKKLGIKSTQATISRISTGDSDPKSSLGFALLRVHKTVISSKAGDAG